MPRSISFLLGGAVGAAAMYFLDPRSGRARRDQAAEEAATQARTAAAAGEAKAREAAEKAQEATAPTPGNGASTPLNDPALKAKVESEIFREADAPKDRISVNVEHDVVVLRGELDSAWLISEMEERARAVEGVVDVQNLLHTPDQPAQGAPGVPEVPKEP